MRDEVIFQICGDDNDWFRVIHRRDLERLVGLPEADGVEMMFKWSNAYSLSDTREVQLVLVHNEWQQELREWLEAN